MKKLTLLLLIITTSWSFAQEKDDLISESIATNVYKPKVVDATEERIANLKLPAGFEIKKFAEDLGEPRILIAGANNNVYVTRRNGDVLLLKDTNGDGRANEQRVVANEEGAHGMAIHDNQFYLITVNDVFRADLKENGDIGELEKIVENLPDGGQHPNRTMHFGPDDMLYISVGSTCNACKETRDESATMVRVNRDGGDRMIFARGLRNTIGYDWHPETGEMWGMDHGIDWLGDDEQKEELNLITEGADYGWPYIYADGKHHKVREPDDMTWEEYAEKSTEPEMLFTAHSAPMNFIFYRGEMFPEEYRKAAIVTFRGSWNRNPPSGYKIMRVDFENGKPVQQEDFVTGFLSEDGTSQFARLVSIIELEDGSLLVSDDENGNIYRISYSR